MVRKNNKLYLIFPNAAADLLDFIEINYNFFLNIFFCYKRKVIIEKRIDK